MRFDFCYSFFLVKITSTPQFWPLPGGNVGGERVDISLPRNNTGAFKVIRYTVIGRRECILNRRTVHDLFPGIKTIGKSTHGAPDRPSSFSWDSCRRPYQDNNNEEITAYRSEQISERTRMHTSLIARTLSSLFSQKLHSGPHLRYLSPPKRC